MSLKEHISNKIYQSSFVREAFASYLIAWTGFTLRYPLGHNIYESDWDALVVLDACRVDAIREVADEYDFINSAEIETKWSVGSTSKEWILKTFIDKYSEEIEETTYISGNSFSRWFSKRPVDYTSFAETNETRVADIDVLNSLFSESLAEEEDFNHVKDLSPLGDKNEYGATPKAEDITEHAIRAGRKHDHRRLIVHYMQPHSPYIGNISSGEPISEYEMRPTKALRNGGDRDKVYESYLDNLRYVLDNVEDLLNNLDAEKVVITADHGELFGEVGQYGHAAGIPHPALKKVPWIETSATDSGEYDPDPPEIPESELSVDDRLRALGYR